MAGFNFSLLTLCHDSIMCRVKNFWENLYHELWLNLIFPKKCLGCGIIQRYLCLKCTETIETNYTQRCIVCQKPSMLGFTHPKCQTKFTPNRLVTAFRYQDNLLSKAIKIGKYHFIQEIFIELAQISHPILLENINNIALYKIIPIPLHKSRLKWRGFNQSEILSRLYSNNNKTLGIVLSLARVRKTKPQKDLSAVDRRRNVAESFSVFSNNNKVTKVLLIDDITTSGATFLEATKALKKTGVKEVICFALTQD